MEIEFWNFEYSELKRMESIIPLCSCMNEYLYLGITTAQVLTFKQAQLKCHFGGIFTHPERKKSEAFSPKIFEVT